jgi:hypothetical protein
MPRQAAFAVENSFRNGLITDATELNFPENACTSTENCVFDPDGSVYRRFGFSFEGDYATNSVPRYNSVVATYLWKNVNGDPDTSFLVKQVGSTLYFYDTNGSSVSSGLVGDTVDLSLYETSGNPGIDTFECQFTSGNGFLFVTHPFCTPLRLEYDVDNELIIEHSLVLKIRDFDGDENDTLDVDTRPMSTYAGLTDAHKYNLFNQGWLLQQLTTWDAGRSDMPSNTDVMWSFKNASDVFAVSTVPSRFRGNSPAPKGHYVLTLWDQNRQNASGITGATNSTASFYRPSTVAFFAGRAFYSGLNYSTYVSKVYFSQIVERNEQYAFCHQLNDPTSETAFDLLPSDGGVIAIQDAGVVYKLFAIPGGLVVFASNGLWFITGSTGLGFTANDYTVIPISRVAPLSAASIVDMNGYPAFWNAEGIYIVTADKGTPKVESLTDGKIRTFFEDIPLLSKVWAKGYFNMTEGVVQWLYRSTETEDVTERYEYDRILNFNTLSGAFYIWTLPENVSVHGLTVLDSSSGSLETVSVVDGSDTVVDADGNEVIAFSLYGVTVSPRFTYLVSYPSGSGHIFTFANESDERYLDWYEYDSTGTDYTSFFVTGYKVRGDAIRKWQSNYVNLLLKADEETSLYFQGIWDYALNGNTGRWSSRQLVTNDDLDYAAKMRRLKVRGHGRALQYKVTSVPETPFHIVGWAAFDTGNQKP